MIIQCGSCSRKFVIKDSDIPEEGRMVQCGYCSVAWHQIPVSAPAKISESLSIDKIKASDGKTYKFLGSRWVELLPSGKLGLFAKKKIGKELDKLTGRKEKNIVKKKQKKYREVEIDTIEKIIDPSSEEMTKKIIDPSSEEMTKQSSDVYNRRQGLGFFGYIFLLIIIGFSIIGILRTFENDLLNSFPETEYIFKLLDEQSEYVAETVKNMIIIIKDLINAY